MGGGPKEEWGEEVTIIATNGPATGVDVLLTEEATEEATGVDVLLTKPDPEEARQSREESVSGETNEENLVISEQVFLDETVEDLVSHNFVEEVTTQVQSGAEDVEPAAKKQKTIESETKSVKKEMAFVSLAETLKVDWSSELYSKRIRRMDPSFFLLHVLFAFRAEMGHNPRASARDEDLKKLQELRDSTLTKLVVPTTKIPDEMLGLLFAELAPVAAIVGGILGQEVIKAISNKDAPHNNYFFYNPLESCGVVETIGY